MDNSCFQAKLKQRAIQLARSAKGIPKTTCITPAKVPQTHVHLRETRGRGKASRPGESWKNPGAKQNCATLLGVWLQCVGSTEETVAQHFP